MPCLFALFAGMFPRFADIIIWIARPTMFMNAFNDKWWWALMYIILWSPGVGLYGWDWFWIVLAVFLDLGHLSHTAYTNRNAIPGYTQPSTPAA
jgi:hypothetical protein